MDAATEQLYSESRIACAFAESDSCITHNTPIPDNKDHVLELASVGGQSRKGSLVESIANIAIGYSINFTANLLVFPLFGWHVSVKQNLALGVIYTAISLARSYALRRYFNKQR
jgi:hypothetical protein